MAPPNWATSLPTDNWMTIMSFIRDKGYRSTDTPEHWAYIQQLGIDYIQEICRTYEEGVRLGTAPLRRDHDAGILMLPCTIIRSAVATFLENHMMNELLTLTLPSTLRELPREVARQLRQIEFGRNISGSPISRGGEIIVMDKWDVLQKYFLSSWHTQVKMAGCLVLTKCGTCDLFALGQAARSLQIAVQHHFKQSSYIKLEGMPGRCEEPIGGVHLPTVWRLDLYHQGQLPVALPDILMQHLSTHGHVGANWFPQATIPASTRHYTWILYMDDAIQIQWIGPQVQTTLTGHRLRIRADDPARVEEIRRVLQRCTIRCIRHPTLDAISTLPIGAMHRLRDGLWTTAAHDQLWETHSMAPIGTTSIFFQLWEQWMRHIHLPSTSDTPQYACDILRTGYDRMVCYLRLLQCLHPGKEQIAEVSYRLRYNLHHISWIIDNRKTPPTAAALNCAWHATITEWEMARTAILECEADMDTIVNMTQEQMVATNRIVGTAKHTQLQLGLGYSPRVRIHVRLYRYDSPRLLRIATKDITFEIGEGGISARKDIHQKVVNELDELLVKEQIKGCVRCGQILLTTIPPITHIIKLMPLVRLCARSDCPCLQILVLVQCWC